MYRFLSILMAIPTLAPLGAQSFTELPVTRVVLFSSGVGFMEHRGKVEGDTVVRLNLSAEQINDVLKSLLLRDDGGTVTSVNFPSQDPLERSLRTFSLDLSSNPGIPELMDQARGAEVEVSTPEKIVGRILGVESRTYKDAEGKERTEVYLNLFSSNKILTLPLKGLSGFKFMDPKISQDLERALQLILASSDTLSKPMDIRFSGKGTRNVSLGYILEAPVWKTSYRLDLSGTKAYIQGWAVVENTTDEDWKDVNLSLVSGRPVSFIQDLYSPLYLARPVVAPSVQAALKPQEYAGGMGALKDERPSPAPSVAAMKSRAYDSAPEDYMIQEKEMDAPLAELRSSPAVAQAEGSSAGELFQFNLKTPMSLARRQSALIPLVGMDIQAEKVSIYNSKVHSTRAYNGAWITNTTGLKLPAGPVTVLDSQVYGGDALLDNLVPQDRRLISFSLDLNTLVDSSISSTTATTGIKVVKGVLTISRKETFTREYRVSNQATEARTMIIEHPIEGNKTLIDPVKYEEKTPDIYRFRLLVPGSGQAALKVKEESPRVERLALLNFQSRNFLSYLSNSEITGPVRKALEKAQTLKVEVESIQEKISDSQGTKTALEADQTRIRANLSSVGRDSTQGKRYLEKLMESEGALEAWVVTMDDLKKKQAKAQSAFEAYINTLDL